MAATTSPSQLILIYDPRSTFDEALKEQSERGHHSRCYFGNKARVAAVESADPFWRDLRIKFMPERHVVHFSYGNGRYEQELTRDELKWLTRFDLGETLRAKKITLDPNGERTRYLEPKGASTRPMKARPRTTTAAPAKPAGRESAAAVRAQRQPAKTGRLPRGEIAVTTVRQDDAAAVVYRPARRPRAPQATGREQRLRQLVNNRVARAAALGE